MKINGSTDPFRGIERPTTSGTGAKAADKAGDSAETVRLSGLSEQLAKLMDQPGQVFDQGRVDEIKDAIRSGQFRVDSDVVADKLLQSVQELVGK